MTVEYVNHEGRPINWGSPSMQPVKKTTAGPEARSLGFQVVGLPPGAIEEARKLHAAQAEANPKSARPWDQAQWLRSAKRQRISTKNLSVTSAAEQMAEMARRQGWTHVEVREVTRGNVEAARAKLSSSRL